MGQGACGGYLRRDQIVSLTKRSYVTDRNHNTMTAELRKIAELEEKLLQKENEIAGLQVSKGQGQG